MRPPAIMIQGTGSDVGKSLIVAGLCRLFTRRGLRVRPFKPQNMSNNAAVTADGGEIGRAQALQARAARLAPSVHMNPILLKPESMTGSQVIVQGAVMGRVKARDYAAMKPGLMPKVLDSYHRLAADADLMLIEGAGSPAEINLRAGDLANMGFAEAADLPVVLVGDIDRGGVLAAIAGTCSLLPAAERARIKAYLINKFRGDSTLFTPAIAILKDRTGLDCLGVVPHLAGLGILPDEDSMSLDHRVHKTGGGALTIAVPRLPSLANADDLDPLRAESAVNLDLVPPGRPLPRDAAIILLPGSKATLADLAFLRREGWDIDLLAHHRAGGSIVGLCGGYQILGRTIADPHGMEGVPGIAPGLGLLDVETILSPHKRLTEIKTIDGLSGLPVQGYEIHLGETTGPGRDRPLLRLNGQNEGAVSPDGRVIGTYLHGLFGADAWRRRYLAGLGVDLGPSFSVEHQIETALDRLADHLAAHVDIEALWRIAVGS